MERHGVLFAPLSERQSAVFKYSQFSFPENLPVALSDAFVL